MLPERWARARSHDLPMLRRRRIRRGVASVTRERKDVLTPDVGGPGTTVTLTSAIIEAVQAQPSTL